MISNRNIESKVDYVLLKPYSFGSEREIKKARFKTIEDAIDNTVKIVSGGEFIKNVKLYLVNEKYFAVEGDVWGLKPQETPITSYKGFKVGDKVQWQDGFTKSKGTITSIDVNDPDIFVIKEEGTENFVKVKNKKLTKIE